jgi:hypothetical protein
MPDPHIQWHQLATRWFRSTKNVLLVAAVAFALLVLWAAPRRVLQVISIGEDFRWNETNAPQRRQVVWQPAEPLEGLLQGDLANADILSPRLAEGGSLLLCTVRHTNGQMDLFSSRFSDGQWQPVQPLKTLNSPAQDIGATISADGRWLWFYSNRAGGFGGSPDSGNRHRISVSRSILQPMSRNQRFHPMEIPCTFLRIAPRRCSGKRADQRVRQRSVPGPVLCAVN